MEETNPQCNTSHVPLPNCQMVAWKKATPYYDCAAHFFGCSWWPYIGVNPPFKDKTDSCYYTSYPIIFILQLVLPVYSRYIPNLFPPYVHFSSLFTVPLNASSRSVRRATKGEHHADLVKMFTCLCQIALVEPIPGSHGYYCGVVRQGYKQKNSLKCGNGSNMAQKLLNMSQTLSLYPTRQVWSSFAQRLGPNPTQNELWSASGLTPLSNWQ